MTTAPLRGLLPHRLVICGIEELPGFAAARVSHVVSILDPDWPEPEAFAAFAPHARVTWRFHDVVQAVSGMAVPQPPDVERILALGERLRAEPVDCLLVHCHAGVSRSTAAAAILMAQGNPGREADVFAALSEVRPLSWPNSLMLSMADELLGRQGALVEAMRAHHARVARAHPPFAAMIRLHRPHEVPE